MKQNDLKPEEVSLLNGVAYTDDAFLPGVSPISETLTGVPLNCKTRPVGFCEKGERTAASTIDFT